MNEDRIDELLLKTSHLIALNGIQNTEEFLNENSIAEIESKNQKLLTYVLKLEQECEDGRAEIEKLKNEKNELLSSENKLNFSTADLKSLEDLKLEKRQLLEKEQKLIGKRDFNNASLEDVQRMKQEIEKMKSNSYVWVHKMSINL